MICWVSWLYGNESSGAGITDFACSDDFRLNLNDSVTNLKRLSPDLQWLIRRGWAPKFYGKFSSDGAGGGFEPLSLHQRDNSRPIGMTIEQGANDTAIEDSRKSGMVFFRGELGSQYTFFFAFKGTNAQALFVGGATAKAGIVRGVGFL
jgi:hypothetical protein